MVYILNRDCVTCGGSTVTYRICTWDPKKREVKVEPGYRPEWCPVDDEQFKKERWEKKTA